MIDETCLSYKRGELVEFNLNLGGGTKRSRGLILNTAVLFGRSARQLWVVDITDATPAIEKAWVGRKHIVPENEILCLIPTALIGRDTLLRDNPVSFPVQDGKSGLIERFAITVTVALPGAKDSADTATIDSRGSN